MRAKLFTRTLARSLYDDDLLDIAAMLTYYVLLAVFPALLLIVTVALLILPSGTVAEGVHLATEALPRDAASLVTTQVMRMHEHADAGFAIGSALFAVWGASRGTYALGFALNRMYGRAETRPWWRRQLLAIGMTLGIAGSTLLLLGALFAGSLLGHAAAARVGASGVFDAVWPWAQYLLAAAYVMFVWALLYRFMPDTRARFHLLTPGAIVGVLLWIGVTRLFALYVQRFSDYEATYGALAGVVIFLLWLWLSNLTFLVGAEINDALATMRHRDHRAPAPDRAVETVPGGVP